MRRKLTDFQNASTGGRVGVLDGTKALAFLTKPNTRERRGYTWLAPSQSRAQIRGDCTKNRGNP